MYIRSTNNRMKRAGIFAVSLFSLTFLFHSMATAQPGQIVRPPRTTAVAVSGTPAFLTDAITKANTPGTVQGQWFITAKVSIRSLDGKEIWVAKGLVNASGEGLVGTIPMSINGTASETNSLNVSIRPTTPVAIGLQRLIAGKPFLGRSPQGFTAVDPPKGAYLSTTGEWNGAVRQIDIELTSDFRKPIAIPGKS